MYSSRLLLSSLLCFSCLLTFLTAFSKDTGKKVLVSKAKIGFSSNEVSLTDKFFEEQIKIITSTDIKTRAKKRMTMYPTLTVCEVTLSNNHSTGSHDLSLTGTGSEFEYTRLFVRAVIDEYALLVKPTFPQTESAAHAYYVNELKDKETTLAKLDDIIAKEALTPEKKASLELSRKELLKNIYIFKEILAKTPATESKIEINVLQEPTSYSDNFPAS